jgi:hypothetical protein
MLKCVERKKGFNEIKLDSTMINYYDQTTQDKIHILDKLLDDSFEIYHRENGNIMLYNLIADEYIYDNGEGACNLPMFWNGLIKESLISKNITLIAI